MPPWFDSFSLLDRGLIRELMCIGELVISTSKDGCTLERVVAAHMAVTLKRMMGAFHSNWSVAKLVPAPQDRATRRIQIFHAWVCVCGYLKLGSSHARERIWPPIVGLMGKNEDERERRNVLLISSPWMRLACTIHTYGPLLGSCGPHSTSL